MANDTPKKPSIKKLSPKESLFVKEYLIDLNASAAYRRAGYTGKSVSVLSCKLLANVKIQSAISKALAEREKRTEITGDMVIKELALIGFQNVQQLYDDNGRLIPVHKLPESVARTISSIRTVSTKTEATEYSKEDEAVIEIKTWDKKGALEQLGRHFKLFTDVSESTNNTSVSLSDTETAAKILSLIETLTQRAAKDPEK